MTKSALVVRDIDILSRLAERGLVKVALSVTTLDRKLARTMEPRASTPTKRLEAIKALSAAGIPASVMVGPVIPGLNDNEIERILDSGRAAGALEAGYVLLRLPLEVAPIFKGLAVASLSGPLSPRDVADPLDARRQGLRFGMGQAHARLRSLRLADRTAFRDCGKKARPQHRLAAAARDRPVHRPADRRQAVDAVVNEALPGIGEGSKTRQLFPLSEPAAPPRSPPLSLEACESEPVRASPHHDFRPRSGHSPTLFEIEDIRPDFSIERHTMKRGQWPVAGLDEAGRDPLADRSSRRQ